MLVGIALTPFQWLIVFLIAVLSLAVPFLIADWLAEQLPGVLKEPIRIALNMIAVPVIICWWYKHHVFSTGRDSAIFASYIWLFGLLAASQIFVLSQDDPMRVPSEVTHLIINAVGFGALSLAFIIWRKKTRASYRSTLANEA